MRGVRLLAAWMVSVPFLTQTAVPAAATEQQSPAGAAAAESDDDGSISAAEARETVADLARLLEQNYVFPDVGRRYAEALRERAARGEYDNSGTRAALAAALTRDARAVHFDGHLRIWPEPASGGRSQMMMAAPPSQQRPPRPARPGPGEPIEEARWLAPGIAYIRFTGFPFDPAVTAAAEAFMRDHAEAETMIFDLRTHGGGGLGQVAAMLPYLFDRETVFVSMGTRASTPEGPPMPSWMRPARSSAEGVRTTEVFVMPHRRERRLFDARVLVLTSSYTVSAGEAFAFGMKTTGRATLIGETTTGAGHYAPPGQRVNDQFGMFLPIGRSFDPRTGQGWEGTGVVPHIQVPAERALVEALVRSGVAPDAAERLSRSVHPRGPMSRPRQSS